MSNFDFEKFLSGFRNVGVGLALSGIVGLFFGQMPLPATAAIVIGLAMLAGGSVNPSKGAS